MSGGVQELWGMSAVGPAPCHAAPATNPNWLCANDKLVGEAGEKAPQYYCARDACCSRANEKAIFAAYVSFRCPLGLACSFPQPSLCPPCRRTGQPASSRAPVTRYKQLRRPARYPYPGYWVPKHFWDTHFQTGYRGWVTLLHS